VRADDEASLPAAAFRSGRAQIVHDFQRHPEALARVSRALEPAGLADPRSAAYLPVRTGQSTHGVICLVLDEPFVLGTMTVLGLVGMLAAEAALAIDRDRLRRELERQASTDALTGMANRRTYAAHLSRELARAKRTGGSVSLVLVDLDHFKGYNDHHGHLGGDALLRTVASGWMAQLREVDLLARLGGDEFAVVLADTDAEAGLVTCRRLLDAMPEGVTASAGIAQWNGDEDQSVFYRRCDEALYAAKNSGRNRASIAP
jgi:diguanylate cyclase (GGDEF)-like protein